MHMQVKQKMEMKLNKEEAPLLALGLVILIVSTALAAIGGTVSSALQEISLAYFVLLLAFVAMLVSYLSRSKA